LLDRSATDTDGDLSRRRFGLILRIFTSRFVDRPEELDPADRDEVRVRHIRALIFSGDLPAARSDLTAWGGPGRAEDEELLRSLADMYLRLDAFDLAAEAERLRASRLLAGSPLWFDARYGLALAYFRSDRFKDARQIIDATAILHPDLGGGELKTRFERLRQRIGQE
jgi:hypothetical protein